MYCFSKVEIKPATKYSSATHGFEMTLNQESDIQRCSEEDAQDVPTIKYEFTEISEIAEKSANDIVGESYCVYCTNY